MGSIHSSESESDAELSRLYKEYGGLIYARCLRILGDGATAEDATQETFIRVFRHIQRVPNEDEALAWISRVATNYCLNEIRNRNRRPALLSALPDVNTGIESIFADSDLARRVIENAPRKYRVVAWLHFVDGLTQEEVAHTLQISRRTVGSRLVRFTKNARKFIHREAG